MSNKRNENRKEDAGVNQLKVSALTSIKSVKNDMPLKVMRLTYLSSIKAAMYIIPILLQSRISPYFTELAFVNFKSLFHALRILFLIYFIILCLYYNWYTYLLSLENRVKITRSSFELQIASHCRAFREIGLLFLIFYRTLCYRQEEKDPQNFEYLVSDDLRPGRATSPRRSSA